MKYRALAISLVLLLIVTSTLPGVSFSLSSSVTSYNNQITVIDDPSESPSFGLYKDSGCSSRWDTSAFGSGIIQVKKISEADPEDPLSHDMVEITVPQTVSMVGTNMVYLWVPEGLSGDVSLSISYADGSPVLPITKAIFKFDGSKETNVTMGSVSKVSLTGGQCYKVSLSIEVSTTSTSIAINTIPSLDVSFSASIDGVDKSILDDGNKINLKYDIEGMEVKSKDHVINGPVADSDINISNGSVYEVVDSSTHFGENNKKVSATVSVDKDHAFYIVIRIGAANNSGVHVTIKGFSTVDYNQDFSSDRNNTVEYYIGVSSGSISFTEGGVGSLWAFQDKDLEIVVSTLKTGQPPTTDLFIVQVPKRMGSSS